MKKIIKKEYTRYENSDRTIFVELWNSDKAIKGIIYDSHYLCFPYTRQESLRLFKRRSECAL